MLPILQIIWHERTSRSMPVRVNEPEAMEGPEQISSYVKAYEWGGPTSALQLHHLRELSRLLRPGDRVLDLACGPGPLLLELAALFPDCSFVGADLSRPMLDHLEAAAEARKLRNISVLHDDVRDLSGIGDATVDLVITTSALHHLPDLSSLHQVFRRMRSLLRAGGGFYVFDFALLRSAKTRALMVKELSRTAPPLTVRDYEMSLQAAFPLADVIRAAEAELPKPFVVQASSFVDFFYFLQSPPRTEATPAVQAYIDRTWKTLSPAIRLEHLMLRQLRRRC